MIIINGEDSKQMVCLVFVIVLLCVGCFCWEKGKLSNRLVII
jgi:hypothetical protein